MICVFAALANFFMAVAKWFVPLANYFAASANYFVPSANSFIAWANSFAAVAKWFVAVAHLSRLKKRTYFIPSLLLIGIRLLLFCAEQHLSCRINITHEKE